MAFYEQQTGLSDFHEQQTMTSNRIQGDGAIKEVRPLPAVLILEARPRSNLPTHPQPIPGGDMKSAEIR